MKTWIPQIAAIALGLSASAAVAAETLAELSNAARAARLKGDHAAWLDLGTRTLSLAPDHPDLLVSVARAAAASGRDAEALPRLEEAVRRGAGFDPAQVPELARLRQAAGFGPVFERAKRNLEPVARAQAFARVADRTARPEGIVYDPERRRSFIGTVNGEILQIDEGGTVSTFVTAAKSGLREVYGLRIDPARQLLWAATSVFPDLTQTTPPAADAGLSGLAAFRLADGARVRHAMLDERPRLHGFNDLAVAADGAVYVTDTADQSIWRLAPDAAAPELFLRDAAMTFPNGIVITPDQSGLIVGHVEGLSLIDLTSRNRRLLKAPPEAAVNSIDGLVWDGESLVAVQGSPHLARIARIRLTPDRLGVASVETLNSRTPEDYFYTTAAVAPGGDIFILANAPAAGPNGLPTTETPPAQVLRIPPAGG